MSINLKKIIIYFCLFYFLLFPLSTFAKSEEEDGVTLWPAFHTLTIKAGSSQSIKISVRNNNDTVLEVEPKFRNIKISSDPYKGISLSKDDEVPPALWLSAVTSVPFSVRPRETLEFESIIEVPENVDSMGYYPVISLRFSSLDEEGEFVFSDSEISSVIYLSVADIKGKEAERKAYIRKFIANRSFLLTPDVKFLAEVENIGDLHFRPRGSVQIYDPSGMRQSDTPTFNDKMVYILPSQTLSEDFTWKDKPLSKLFPPFGNYRAVFELYLEEDRSQILQSEVNFFVFPIQYIVVLILLLEIFVYILYKLIKWKKSKKEKFIALS